METAKGARAAPRHRGRKLALRAANFAADRLRLLDAVGALARIARAPLVSTVFVAYPADESYADAYVDRGRRERMRWDPWPAGLFRQGGRWGLLAVISSVERDFRDPANAGRLADLVRASRRIAARAGAPRVSFAGVLPGILARRGIEYGSDEAETTVAALLEAERALRARLGWDFTPLILLGGGGFIGASLARQFRIRGREVRVVEGRGEGPDPARWPWDLAERRAVLVNLAPARVLERAAPLLWEDLAVLNEAYPAPAPEALRELALKGVRVFHLAGVEARAWPPFPKAYRGGVPCCAAMNLPELRPLIRELAPAREPR